MRSAVQENTIPTNCDPTGGRCARLTRQNSRCPEAKRMITEFKYCTSLRPKYKVTSTRPPLCPNKGVDCCYRFAPIQLLCAILLISATLGGCSSNEEKP